MNDFISEKSTKEVNMLLNFRVRNVLSFKELQEFSFVAGKSIRMKERVRETNNMNILKFSAVYGANAAGKSNLVKALKIMKNIVYSSLPNYDLEYYYKFQDVTKMEASYFEVAIIINGDTYSYGFECDFKKSTIINEWLYKIQNNNEKIIFERSNNNITYGNYFSEKTKNKLDQYTPDFVNKNNMLLLKFLNTDKDSIYEYKDTNILKEVYQWFFKGLNIAGPNSLLTSIDNFKIEGKICELSNFIKCFDTGIETIKSKGIEIKDLPYRLKGDKDVIDGILSDIKDYSLDRINRIKNTRKVYKITNMIRLYDDLCLITVSKTGDISVQTVIFVHKDVNEKEYEMGFMNESDGTKRIIELAGVLLNDDIDKLFVVDELDRCLHPQLTCKFVELFLKNAEKKNNNNQLLVTTHESRLLDQDLLRRDEVWFVSKKDNASTLYSLEEYNVRFDKKIDKAYMEGRYGGVPIFDQILLEKMMRDENKEQCR